MPTSGGFAQSTSSLSASAGYPGRVALGPDNPTWKKLYEALARLAAASGGPFAFVIDEGNGLWSVGLADSPPTTSTA
jgi:hypothetical protein